MRRWKKSPNFSSRSRVQGRFLRVTRSRYEERLAMQVLIERPWNLATYGKGLHQIFRDNRPLFSESILFFKF